MAWQSSEVAVMSYKEDVKQQAVKRFQEYIRIRTDHPNVDYEKCVVFLRQQAEEVGLSFKDIRLVANKPILVLTWTGTTPELPGILLNSHMDVVPADSNMWTYPPFEAHRDADGVIYGRGTQDMKVVGIQYLEAVRRLKASGFVPKRNIHISFVPDEEIGGKDGMQKFVKSEEFQHLNIGCALDEGMAFESDVFIVFYGERSSWQIEVHCPGTQGHGSQLVDDPAAEKVQKVLEKFLAYRQSEKLRMESDPQLNLGDVTTINVTMLKGGVQINVIPAEMSVLMDMRIAPSQDHEEFESMLKKWCDEAGKGIYIESLQKGIKEAVTPLDDSNIWWKAFKSATDTMKLNLKPVICPGTTDARFIRRLGIPALGFSPLNFTPILLHNKNECVSEAVFLRGIDIYSEIIRSMTNV